MSDCSLKKGKRKRKSNNDESPTLWDREMTENSFERYEEDIQIVLEMFKNYDFPINENLIRRRNVPFETLRSNIGSLQLGIGLMIFNAKNDEIIGFSLCFDSKFLGNNDFEIVYLFIIPEFRKKNIGKYLISKCEKEAKKRQHTTLVTCLTEEYKETKGFWEKMKFHNEFNFTKINANFMIKKI